MPHPGPPDLRRAFLPSLAAEAQAQHVLAQGPPPPPPHPASPQVSHVTLHATRLSKPSSCSALIPEPRSIMAKLLELTSSVRSSHYGAFRTGQAGAEPAATAAAGRRCSCCAAHRAHRGVLRTGRGAGCPASSWHTRGVALRRAGGDEVRSGDCAAAATGTLLPGILLPDVGTAPGILAMRGRRHGFSERASLGIDCDIVQVCCHVATPANVRQVRQISSGLIAACPRLGDG